MITEKPKLNPEQQSAVTHTVGPLLIVAGAGTGKTTVLIQRLAHLIKNNLAKPDEILITTFTEKAAGEMEIRADKILPYGYVDLWINTFHGFCERILRDKALDIGLSGNFKLLDQTQQWVLIRKNLYSFDLDYYRPLGNPTKFIHELIRHFSRLKDENISPQEYLRYAEELRQDSDSMLSGSKIPRNKKQETNKSKKINEKSKIGNWKLEIGNLTNDLEAKRINELANAFHRYNQILLDQNYLDFGDLICYTLKLFNERPNILQEFHEKFKYIMVDEFQDTNWAQYELVKLLAKPDNNLIVVGDDDQAIYRFRGASMSNIMQFKDDFPEAAEIVLTSNYRSGHKILDTAYKFIQNNNPNRLEIKLKIAKDLKGERKEKGEVEHLHFEKGSDETSGVIEKIIALYEADDAAEWSDFAILARANDTAEKFRDELTRMNIPNQFVSMRGLYLKPVIIDIISYFRLLDNYHESAALFRVLNMEIFKVGHSDLVAINKFARAKVWSLYEALDNIQAIPGTSPEAAANIAKLMALIKKHSASAQQDTPAKIYVKFVHESGLLSGLDHDRDQELFDYLNQFYKKIKEVESSLPDMRIKDFLELFNMEEESGETGSLKMNFTDADTVKIMTVHAAKGLEFKYVFLVNLVDKKFPTITRGEKIPIPDAIVREKLPEGDTHLEEERRLFYVALTRARDRLFLTSASDYGGARDKKVSKFVAEAGFDLENLNRIKLKEEGHELLEAIKESKKESVKTLCKYELPAKFSFSQLEAYSNCPLQYKFAFLLKIPVPEKANLVFGRLMHNTLRDFLLTSLAPSVSQQDLFGKSSQNQALTKPTLEALMEMYEKNWVDNGYASRDEKEKYHRKGREILKLFYAKLESEGWPKVKFLEKSFTVRIGQYMFRGAIDRVDITPDGSYEIADYKTGKPKENLQYSDKKQLILYKIALEELFKLNVSTLSFYYLENNEKISFEAKEKDIDKLKLEIVKQIEEIKECNFVPKPGPLCTYCDFRGICEFRK